MAWIQLRIHTHRDHAEMLGDLLMDQGSVSITYEDGQDEPIFEPKLGETPLWQDTILIALFDAETDLAPTIEFLETMPFLGKGFSHKIEQVEDKDWVREWMDSFHPIKFGQRLWICPSWREIPDPQAVNVILDPGLAFGTGTHPTTALCLEWLDSLDLTDQEVIDFGCGSGILAIAAIKLGAKKVTGVDIDYQAIDAAKANAERNDVVDQLALYLPENQPENLQADVLVANILAGPLKELKEVICGYGQPGTLVALSGILAEQANDVANAYQELTELLPPKQEDEWVRINGKIK